MNHFSSGFGEISKSSCTRITYPTWPEQLIKAIIMLSFREREQNLHLFRENVLTMLIQLHTVTVSGFMCPKAFNKRIERVNQLRPKPIFSHLTLLELRGSNPEILSFSRPTFAFYQKSRMWIQNRVKAMH